MPSNIKLTSDSLPYHEENGYAHKCFPVRNIRRFKPDDGGAWLVEYKSEKERQLGRFVDDSSRFLLQKKKQQAAKVQRKIRELTGFFLTREFHLDEPSGLFSINITGKQLHSVKDEDFSLFGNVLYIEAGDNHLAVETFKSFPRLEELHLQVNGICDINISHEEFLHLKRLDLSYNKLRDDALLSLGKLRNIKELTLRGCSLKSLPSELARAYVVCLEDRDEKRSKAEQKRRFPMLEHLDLSENRLTDLSTFSSLAGLRKLKTLNLSSNKISGVPHLRFLVSHRHFSASTCKCSSPRQIPSIKKSAERTEYIAKAKEFCEITNSIDMVVIPCMEVATDLNNNSTGIATDDDSISCGTDGIGGVTIPKETDKTIEEEYQNSDTDTHDIPLDDSIVIENNDVEVVDYINSEIDKKTVNVVINANASPAQEDLDVDKDSAVEPEVYGEVRLDYNIVEINNGVTHTEQSNDLDGSDDNQITEDNPYVNQVINDDADVNQVISDNSNANQVISDNADENGVISDNSHESHVLHNNSLENEMICDDLLEMTNILEESEEYTKIMDIEPLEENDKLLKMDFAKEINFTMNFDEGKDGNSNSYIENGSDPQNLGEDIINSNLKDPFLSLKMLDLSNNVITQEESLLALTSWPALQDLKLWGNPLMHAFKGIPPVIAHHLRKMCGINIHRKEPQSDQSHSIGTSITKSVKSFRVKNDLPPIKKNNMMMIEAAIQKAIEEKELPIETENEEQIENDDGKKEILNKEEVYEETENVFLTQVDDEDINLDKPKGEIMPQKDLNKDDAIMTLYTGYDELLKIDETYGPESDIHVPSTVYGCAEALRHMLKHPLVFKEGNYNRKRLNLKEKKTKTALLPAKKEDKVLEALNFICTKETTYQENLATVLDQFGDNIDIREKFADTKEIVKRVQQKYDKVRLESLRPISVAQSEFSRQSTRADKQSQDLILLRMKQGRIGDLYSSRRSTSVPRSRVAMRKVSHSAS